MRRYGLLNLAFLLLLPGCFPHVQPVPRAANDPPLFEPLPDKLPTLVEVAISGGGSRAAYFGAAGLEVLAKVRSVQVGNIAFTIGGVQCPASC